MQSDHLLHINVTQITSEPLSLRATLTDDFFTKLEQDEIKGGRVNLQAHVCHSAGDIYTVTVKLEGEVTVQCDRCLDDLSLPVKVNERLFIKFGIPAKGDNDDMLYAENGQLEYDLSWPVYELIETSLPLQRAHSHGECNPDMLRYIHQED